MNRASECEPPEFGAGLGILELAKRAFTLKSPSAANVFMLQEPASSGERVTEETALFLVPVYRAVWMISHDLGRLPIQVQSRTEYGTEPIESPAADLLNLDANRYMGGLELRRTLTSQALRYGNAFAQIVRSGRGEVLELVPMLPGDVSMKLVNGAVSYRHAEVGDLDYEDVLHIRAPGSDGLWGQSPIRQAREALGLMRAMEKTGGMLYKQAGVPKLAFVHPGSLSGAAMQSISDSYMANHGGADNAGRPLVLGEGMKVEKVNLSLEDQMWHQAREFSIQEVSRLFGVPVVYLADHSRATFASIVELTRTYWDGCLAHWSAIWGEEIRRKLLAPGQSVSWDTRDLLKGSFSDQVSSLRSAIEVGLMTANEARERLGLNPLEGLDEPLRPQNTAAVADDEEADDEE